MVGQGSIVAVAGLARESRILAGRGGRTVSGGGDPAALDCALDEFARTGARGFISIGIAGGLAPDLACGRIVVGTGVIAQGERWMADPAWSANLRRLFPEAATGDVAAGNAAIATTAEKARRYRAEGAIAADMESHVVSRVATRQGLPFAVLRVVADTAEDGLPPAALAGMGPGGRIDLRAVMLSLIAGPGQLPDLVRAGRRARRALGVLLGCRDVLGAGFGFPNLGELALDVG